VYVRAERNLLDGSPHDEHELVTPTGKLFRMSVDVTARMMHVSYTDVSDGSRIISSRRVERAVETDDFLRLCAEEGLTVTYYGDLTTHPCLSRKWFVEAGYQGDTLREAYYRYHAAADDTRPWLEHTDVIRAG
jgi:hypothetical protein